MNINFNFSASRYFTNWLIQNKCNIIISSFNTGHVLTISQKNNNPFIYYTCLPRTMGMFYKKNKLTLSSLGNLITYDNIGEINDCNHGLFDINFKPSKSIYEPDVDIHDIVVTKQNTFYISSLFSCICTPSKEKYTFDVYWKPPWISKIINEDRCHLNGLCCIDEKPAFVTSVSKLDITRSWSDCSGKKMGIVYDIVNNKIVCDNLSFPHSPRWHQNKLWILESGTGYFGYIENGEFKKKVFIPGFLRGLSFHNNYAIVTTSLDRHLENFKKFELFKNIQNKNTNSKCGVWIIDIETFAISQSLIFKGDIKELYDIVIIPDCNKSRILEINDSKIIQKYNIKQ